MPPWFDSTPPCRVVVWGWDGLSTSGFVSAQSLLPSSVIRYLPTGRSFGLIRPAFHPVWFDGSSCKQWTSSVCATLPKNIKKCTKTQGCACQSCMRFWGSFHVIPLWVRGVSCYAAAGCCCLVLLLLAAAGCCCWWLLLGVAARLLLFFHAPLTRPCSLAACCLLLRIFRSLYLLSTSASFVSSPVQRTVKQCRWLRLGWLRLGPLRGSVEGVQWRLNPFRSREVSRRWIDRCEHVLKIWGWKTPEGWTKVGAVDHSIERLASLWEQLIEKLWHLQFCRHNSFVKQAEMVRRIQWPDSAVTLTIPRDATRFSQAYALVAFRLDQCEKFST